MIKRMNALTARLSGAKDLSLLALRLILAYGFYEPAKSKVLHFGDIAGWFDSLGIPFPSVNAALATGTEVAGVVLLTLGLGTRLITVPLMITMVVAIITVHWGNGFAAGDNGLEIPLYYLTMLFTLMTFGSGRYSVDRMLRIN